MLYEIKDRNRIPKLFVDGKAVRDGIKTVEDARNWLARFLTEEQLEDFICAYEAGGYARIGV